MGDSRSPVAMLRALRCVVASSYDSSRFLTPPPAYFLVDGPFTGLYRTVSLQPPSSDSSHVDLLQKIRFCTAEQDI